MSEPLSERAQPDTTPSEGQVDKQIHELVTLLLQRLLEEIGDGYEARLVVALSPADADELFADDDDLPYSSAERPAGQHLDHPDEVAFRHSLVGDGMATLTVGAGPGHPVSGAAEVREAAERYLSPMAASLDLGHVIRTQRDTAQQAVQQVERSALLDLASGVVMARRRIDAPSARAALAAWSERTGIAIDSLTPSTMLELLTDDQL